MNLPGFSVRRPVLTSMVTSIVALLGFVAVQRLQIDLLPNIELPTVSVRTEYAGASPEVMERLVTQIVEEIVATVPGVVELRSQSAQGNSEVQVTFGWGTDVNAAALDLQGTLEDEINELPEEITRPNVRKFDIASFPVVLLGISSKLDPIELTEIVENQLRHRFSRIPDIAQVDLWGGYPREVRIELDPERVKALALPLDQILGAIGDANLDLPAGKLEAGRLEVTLRAPAEYQSVEEIRQTVVATSNGAAVTLGQIARIHDTYEKLTRIVRVNGDLGIRLAIRKQANANTVEVSRRVLEVADQINAEFPQVKIVPVINQGNFIERSIENVAKSVLYGGLLAVFILLFFLASLRSTGVIGVSIPVSILATLAMIYFAGLTINLTTLGGLALGVGMMVDSSIVVLENVFRRRDEDRETLVVASVTGAREVAGAIVASTITTLVVFLPLAFVRGVSGLLFSELAYVVVFSLVCSLVVSLTLLPMLASRLLASETEPPPWAQRAKLLLQRLNVAYLRVLERALTRPRLAIGSAVALLAASLLLAPLIGTEFLPPSDEGEVRIQGEMEVGTRLSLVDRQTQKMERIVTPAVPEAIASVVNVGASGRRPEQASQGQIQLSIGSAADRDRSNTEIAADLRKRLEGQIPGMRIRVRAPQGSFILERVLGGEEGLAIEIRGFDLERLDALGQVVAAAVRDVDGITDVEVTREAGIPQEEIHIDRAKVADLGLTVRDVTQAIQTAVAGSEAGEYRKEGNSYRILVQLADVEELSLDEVLGLTLRTANGEAVTIGSVVDTRASLGPLVIHRKNQQRIVTVNANVAGRDLGSVASDVEARLAQVPRPAGYEVTVSGAFEEQEKAFSELLVSLALALLLVYMVLASQYESLRDPLIVMLSVPLATIGVLVTLFLTGTTLNVQSYIGCIMLGGIVVNNAILLVDQAGALMRDGRSSREAATEAGRRRLRPILMTTATTILGLLPLALGIGEGADAQAPLARAVIGGLLGSTPVTLVLIPAVFMLVHRKDAS
ncbi:MAG: efflux RND transporter permease subunit [Deltaproteobacteria bacterium]